MNTGTEYELHKILIAICIISLSDAWSFDSPSKDITIKSVMLLPNLMSQKSSPKASDNFNKDRRFKLWKDSNVNSLLSECMAIQQRLSNSNINRDEKHISRTSAYFTKSGNINTVLRLLSENPDSSVLSYNALQKIKLKDSEANLNYNVLMLSAH